MTIMHVPTELWFGSKTKQSFINLMSVSVDLHKCWPLLYTCVTAAAMMDVTTCEISILSAELKICNTALLKTCCLLHVNELRDKNISSSCCQFWNCLKRLFGLSSVFCRSINNLARFIATVIRYSDNRWLVYLPHSHTDPCTARHLKTWVCVLPKS